MKMVEIKYIPSNVLAVLIICSPIFQFSYSTAESEQNRDGHCVWYGVCKTTGSWFNKKYLYCSYNGTAKRLNNDGLEELNQYCSYLTRGRKHTFTCCDNEQIDIMNDDIKWLKRFLSSSNCPGCFENFARPICEMTCSPKQSQFLKVQKVEAADADYRPYVKSMDYSIAHQHLKATFTSCKMVTFLFRPVLNYMCGDAKGEDCTLDKWRNYLIEFSKEYHPFQINYITEPIKNYTSINVPCS